MELPWIVVAGGTIAGLLCQAFVADNPGSDFTTTALSPEGIQSRSHDVAAIAALFCILCAATATTLGGLYLLLKPLLRLFMIAACTIRGR